MSVSDDIGNLFQRFGGDADHYQEVARDDDAKHAASRWPLLTALDIGHPEHVPGAGRPAPVPVPAPVQAAALAQPEQTPAAAPRVDDAPPPAAAGEGAVALSGLVRAPLFARAHRHATMPPPADPARQAASRFSVPPASQAPGEPRVTAAPVAPSAALVAAHTSAAPIAAAAPAPAATAATATLARLATAVAPAIPAAPPSAPSASTPVPAASAPAAALAGVFTAPSAQREERTAAGKLFESKLQTFAPSAIDRSSLAAPAAPAAPQREARPATAGASILSNLFSPGTPADAAPQHASRDLAGVFERLASAPHAAHGTSGNKTS